MRQLSGLARWVAGKEPTATAPTVVAPISGLRYHWPAPFNRVQIRSNNPVNWTQFEGGHSMPRGKKYRAEEIIPKLREAEILISQGSTARVGGEEYRRLSSDADPLA